MDEITTVSTPAAESTAAAPSYTPATVFGYAPEPTAVDAPAASEQGEQTEAKEPEPAQEQTVDADESAPGVDGQQLEGKKQNKIGSAFAKESRRLEKKYRDEYERKLQTSPVYQAGERLITDIMDREGISREEATKVVEDRWLDAVSQREGISKAVAKRLYGSRQEQAVEQQQPENTGDLYGGHTFEDAARELSEMELPDGFDLDAAAKDSAFAELLRDMPPSAAVRVYHAEKRAAQAPQDIAEKLRARQSVPQSERPNQPATPTVNFDDMSDEDFLAYKQKMQRRR